LNELANKLHAQLYTVLRVGAIQSPCQQRNGPSLDLNCLKNKGFWLVGQSGVVANSDARSKNRKLTFRLRDI